jgi:hypothetical protein
MSGALLVSPAPLTSRCASSAHLTPDALRDAALHVLRDFGEGVAEHDDRDGIRQVEAAVTGEHR